MSQYPGHDSHDAGQRPRTLSRWRLVLRYNPAHELMYIVRTLMEVLRLGRAEATHKMWESYHCARSVLLTTYKERAELLVELFAARGLQIELEPNE